MRYKGILFVLVSGDILFSTYVLEKQILHVPGLAYDTQYIIQTFDSRCHSDKCNWYETPRNLYGFPIHLM